MGGMCNDTTVMVKDVESYVFANRGSSLLRCDQKIERATLVCNHDDENDNVRMLRIHTAMSYENKKWLHHVFGRISPFFTTRRKWTDWYTNTYFPVIVFVFSTMCIDQTGLACQVKTYWLDMFSWRYENDFKLSLYQQDMGHQVSYWAV